MRKSGRLSFRDLAIILICPTLIACALGPDFERPSPPDIHNYTAAPLPLKTASAPTRAGNTQYFTNGRAIEEQWWEIFHSKPLNNLIIEALRANPDLETAEIALRIAHENTLVQQALFYPYVSGNFNPTRQLIARTFSPPLSVNGFLYSLYTPQLSISYIPDVFGLNRRQVESLKAEEEVLFFQQQAAYLSLTSNVVLAVIQEASLRAQIKATKQSIRIAAELMKLMKLQRSLGQIGADAVAAQEALLAQTQSALPPLQKQLAAQRHLLTVLCGHFPSETFAAQFTLDKLTLPRELPISLPSQLVEKRPDIRAIEAEMHAASAQIGVAIINRLPNIILSANAGSDPLSFATILQSSTNFWTISANLAQPLFTGGALLHRQHAAVAQFEQTKAQYRSVVLSAFQNVADTLTAIQADAQALKVATAQVNAAYKSFIIAKQEWKVGMIGYLPVLNAEQTYQQGLINLAQSQANRFADTAALFQALGGGW